MISPRPIHHCHLKEDVDVIAKLVVRYLVLERVFGDMGEKLLQLADKQQLRHVIRLLIEFHRVTLIFIMLRHDAAMEKIIAVAVRQQDKISEREAFNYGTKNSRKKFLRSKG